MNHNHNTRRRREPSPSAQTALAVEPSSGPVTPAVDDADELEPADA